jgi:energy-coupling factor transporter ATP-binding protein EcfA2
VADPVASWSYVAPAVPHSRLETEGQQHALAAALRSAHANQFEVDLVLTSGPSPQLGLFARTPHAARSVSRLIRPAYSGNAWRGRSPLALPSESPRKHWTAERILGWPTPIVPEGVVSLVDAWLLSMSAIPQGASVRIAAHPAAVSLRRAWPPPSRVPLGPPSPAPPRRPASPVLPPVEPPHAAFFWEVTVTASVGWDFPDGDSEEAFRRGLELAARPAAAGGLRFRRCGAVLAALRAGVGAFPVSDSEFALFWPTTSTAVATASEAFRPLALPLGRAARGGIVTLPIEPDQGRHVAVLGETGMGKSSLLVALARRAFHLGGGVVFDPLGETIRSLESELADRSSARLVRIAPDVPHWGINALEGISLGPGDDPTRAERRVNDLVHALRRVRAGRYVDSAYWGPRLEEMVTRAVRAAASLPGGTLVDAHTLLATGARLGRPVPPEAIDSVRDLADRIRERPEDADGARRLLHEIVRSPVLVRMLCASEPTVHASALTAPGLVVLISGNAAEVGESTARYLLSVYLAILWSELLSQSGREKSFVILDEAQWFAHESLAEMLRLGRRKNLHVILGTQAVASLPEPVQEAAWTNVADFVAFRGSPDEAREFARLTRCVTSEQILALPRGEAAVLLGKGHAVHWVRTSWLPGGVPMRGPPSGEPERRPPSDPKPEGPERTGGRKGPGEPAGVADPRDAEPGVERILLEIERLGSPGEGVFAVSLEQLRRAADPGGEVVRRVGSELRRAGILLRTERDAGGTRWVLEPSRFRERRAGRPPAGVVRASNAPQPS